MDDEMQKSIQQKNTPQGVLDHEASIWEVLRKSEESIRIEKKKLDEEKIEMERMKKNLLGEKEEIAKLKDDVISQKSEAINEREKISQLKDQQMAQREKMSEVLARLDVQRSHLKSRIEQVNRKVAEVEEKDQKLREKERSLLKTADDIEAKKKELSKWEKEIVEKDKDIAKRTKPLLERETAIQNRERELNERERAINQAEERRLSKERDLSDRGSKLLEKEKSIQDEYEKLLASRLKLAERENRLLSLEKVLEEGEDLEPIRPLSTEIEEDELEKVSEDFGLGKIEKTSDELFHIAVETEGVPSVKTEEEKPDTIQDEEELTVGEDIPCPTCGTMINKDSTTCYACGANILPESYKVEEVKVTEELPSDTPSEIESTEIEKNMEEEIKEEQPLETESYSEEAEIEGKVEEEIKEEQPVETESSSEETEVEGRGDTDEMKLPSVEDLYTLGEDQLVALCESLGLETSGRSKHLRERVMSYMGYPVGGEEEIPSKEGEAPLCPDCGKELTYIEQYDRWYCYDCEKYAPITDEE